MLCSVSCWIRSLELGGWEFSWFPQIKISFMIHEDLELPNQPETSSFRLMKRQRSGDFQFHLEHGLGASSFSSNVVCLVATQLSALKMFALPKRHELRVGELINCHYLWLWPISGRESETDAELASPGLPLRRTKSKASTPKSVGRSKNVIVHLP